MSGQWLEQTVFSGEDRSLGAVGRGGFDENAAHMVGRGVGADEQPFADLPVGQPVRDQAEHVDLSLCQAVGQGCTLGMRSRVGVEVPEHAAMTDAPGQCASLIGEAGG